jgi:elongation factor G
MAKAPVQDIRNVALCGHSSCGKTTLADSFLVMTGTVSANPSVDDGNSICDFDEEEKHHKHTIEAKAIHFKHANLHFNVLDTPGYPDFIGQTICALSGVDTAAIVINAHSGIEVNARRVFNEAGKMRLGRIIVINKLDDENADFAQLLESIREMWGPQCVPLNVPIGKGADFKGVASTLKVPADTSAALIDPATINEQLVESIIEVDEAVMERYFEGTLPTEQEISSLLIKSVAAGSLIPIVCCSAKADVGLQELLNVLAMAALPQTAREITATKDGQEVKVNADPSGPVIARVFRTRVDPFVQKLSFIRVYSGTIKKDDHIPVAGIRKGIKIGPPLLMQASDSEPVDAAGPGSIIAIAKMDELHTGAMLGDYELPPIKLPTPMVGLAIMPKTRGDETKLSSALHKIVEEDSTCRLTRDAQTKELVMTGMSDLHLALIQEKLKRRDKIEVETKTPKIPFHETIQTEAEGSYRHKKQSGGRGQFGEVHIRMFPLPRDVDHKEFAVKSRFPSMKELHYDPDHNFLWIDSVVGGTIPGNFMPAIEKGFKERIASGVIAGYQVQDVCVEVHFGKHHPVDSSEAAFKTAGKQAFKQVFEKAKPSLLEPVVTMDITVPEANVGDVYSDMSSRGGRVLGADAAGGSFQTVHCEVPLREVTTYSRALSSMTGGMGSFTMDFSHYDFMPANIQQQVIANSSLTEDDDE